MRPFMLEAAHRGALHRGHSRVIGVHFDDPAEPVGLMGFFFDIETVVKLALGVPVAGQTITFLVPGLGMGVGELAPGGHATGAIVEGPEHTRPGRIRLCLQAVMTGRRARQTHPCVGRDTAIKGAVT